MSLLHELACASRFARDPRLAEVLVDVGLDRRLVFGIAWVAFHGITYEPVSRGGDACLIVPVFDGGCFVDLAACSLRGRRVATRRHAGLVLGEERIAQAVERQDRLLLFADPWRWLVAGRCGAVVLDWSRASLLFLGVREIACDSLALVHRVHATTRRMADPPRLLFRQQRTARYAA